jgi:hypothetical protein
MTRMRVVPRMFSESASRFGGDDKKEVSAVDSIKTKPPAQELVEKFDGDGNRILYEGTQEMTARLMFSASCFNIIYWTYYSVSAYYYQGVVLHGIEMGGDPRWGLAGAFGTGLMLYFTKEFAHHAARQAYETADGKRIGFVMHNILGGRGKKVEVHIGNARIINRKASTFGASLIPVRVKGLGKNVLIDDKGSFYDQDRLFDLLGQGRVTAGESGAGGMLGGDDDEAFPAQIDTKEARLEARKRAYKAGGKKGKKGKKQQF